MPRVFFGLELPEAIKTQLLALQAPIDGAKWQGRGQLHLTLAFIGEVDEKAMADLCRAASRVHAPAFDLEVTGLNTFGSPERPRNLWAGIGDVPQLFSLQRQLSEQLTRAGFEISQSTFRPHITVARFHRQAGSVVRLLEQRGNEWFGRCPVTGFVLFESAQGPIGSVYTVVERFPLARPLDETPPSDQ